MKFSIPAFLLLKATATISADQILRNGQGRDRHLAGKKGGKDCTDDFEVLSGPCPIEILGTGRYVLEEDLLCGSGSFGIVILANDVLLDCQDNQIRDFAGTGFFGIGVSASEHVTVTNCNVRQFTLGFLADPSEGDWDDLVIENSSFNQNTEDGMLLIGNAQNPGEFTVTVIGSQFNENGGDGVEVQGVDGTFISSQMNRNSGSLQYGFYEETPSFLKLIDITTNNNGDAGIFAQDDSQSLEIIRSTACFNDAFDGSALETDIDANEDAVAQGNTCDTSFPDEINGRLICECPCPGQRKKSSVTSSITDTTSTGNATKTRLTKKPSVVGTNETVAAIVGGV
jgi:hypothetical protein